MPFEIDTFDDQFERTQHTVNAFFVIVPVLMVVFIAIGIAATVWRVRSARTLARSAGIDESAATMAALTDQNAMSAMIVASRLGEQHGGDVANRLRQLDDLKRQGLLTDAEYSERRAAIVNQL